MVHIYTQEPTQTHKVKTLNSFKKRGCIWRKEDFPGSWGQTADFKNVLQAQGGLTQEPRTTLKLDLRGGWGGVSAANTF